MIIRSNTNDYHKINYVVFTVNQQLDVIRQTAI